VRAKRTDKSQSAIVKQLRQRGAQVIVTNFGNDFPDLLIGLAHWSLVEIKEADGDLSRGQLQFLSDAKGRVGVATNFDDALEIAAGVGHLTLLQKEAITKWLYLNHSQQSLSVRKFFKLIGK